MKRYGQLIGVKPEVFEEYKRYHGPLARHPEDDLRVQHPQLLDLPLGQPAVRLFRVRRRRLRRRHGEDGCRPETQLWWDIMKPMQSPIPSRAEGEWWANLDEVFHTD